MTWIVNGQVMETPLRPDGVACPWRLIGLAEFVTFARDTGRELRATGHSNATPRSVVFNVQGFRVAVHGQTGEIRILDSIHAADAGVVINLMQCRGQVEGGIATALGAALFEEVAVDATRHVANRKFVNIVSHPSRMFRAAGCILPTPSTGLAWPVLNR